MTSCRFTGGYVLHYVLARSCSFWTSPQVSLLSPVLLNMWWNLIACLFVLKKYVQFWNLILNISLETKNWGVKIQIHRNIRTTFLWWQNQDGFVMCAYYVYTKKPTMSFHGNKPGPLPFRDACWLSKCWCSAPCTHVSHYLSFSCLHFLRQKLRISVAGVGGWGPARVGIVFSFSPNWREQFFWP